MSNSPLVSVIIPAHNAGKFIAQALQSVVDQSWDNLQIIVVNDGSTDNTSEIISSFSDPRITIIDQKNKGCSPAKIAGLSVASGDFIQYLDADDILSKDKIQDQVNALQKDQNKIAVCRTIRFSDVPRIDKTKEIDTKFLYPTDKPVDFLLKLYGLNGENGMIQPNAFLVPAGICKKGGGWDVSISPSPDEDGEYFCRMILASEGIIYTPDSINFYRSGSQNSLSKQYSYKYAEGALRSIELKLKHLLRVEDSERVRKVMAIHFGVFIYLYYDVYPGLIKEAKKKLKEMGYNKIPSVGGENFKKLSAIIGTGNALQLRKIVRKVFS